MNGAWFRSSRAGTRASLKELIREAAELPESDRATLAGVMIESLEPKPTPEVKAAWSRVEQFRADVFPVDELDRPLIHLAHVAIAHQNREPGYWRDRQ